MDKKSALDFGTGKLYSPFPIPAYQVLAQAKQYKAQRVLLALVSHMGRNNRKVFPSYTRIQKCTGLSRKSISEGLITLLGFGFIKVHRHRRGKENRSIYYLQDSCWDTSQMNKESKELREAGFRCYACYVYLDRGDFALSGTTRVHWGCGGIVLPVAKREMPRNQIPRRS
jgi:hypothetical protein